MSGYPITLVSLESVRCVVVGGGEVALRKVAALREAGARPVVISPDLSEALREQAERGEIETIQRAYEPGDLDGALLVIAATDDPETNQAVWRETQAAGSLLDILGEQRESIADACPPEKRRDLCYELVDSDLLELLAGGREREARERAAAIVDAYLEG